MSLTLAMAIMAGVGAVASAAGGVYARSQQRKQMRDDAYNKMLMIQGQQEDLTVMKNFNIELQNKMFESTKGYLNRRIGDEKISRGVNASIASNVGISQNKLNYLAIGQAKNESMDAIGSAVQSVATSGFRQSSNTTNASIAVADRASLKYRAVEEEASMSSAQAFTSAMNSYIGSTQQIDKYKQDIEREELNKNNAIDKINLEYQIDYDNLQNQYDYYKGINESKYSWADFGTDAFAVTGTLLSGTTDVLSTVNSGKIASTQQELYNEQLKYYRGE